MRKSQAVQLLESEGYLQAVIKNVKEEDPQTQLESITEWLGDVDRGFELGSSYSALMRHAKTVQNYIKKNC
jgi:hypothetical protein